MCTKRKQYVYNEKKMLNGQRADKEMYPVQVVQHRQFNEQRHDDLYNEAMEKRLRREKLQEQYAMEQEQYDYQPKINQRS